MRKDQRTQVRDPLTACYVALFESVGCDCVLTFDVHNLAAFENAFRRAALKLRACARPAARHFSDTAAARPTVVVTPDFGGAKRAEAFRRERGERCGYLPDFILVEKYRRDGVISGGALEGDVRGKSAIIIDDLISSGTTLSRAAPICRDAGAAEIYAAATHGLLIGAQAMLQDPVFHRIVITDTVIPWQSGPNLRILDSTWTTAAAIRMLHTGFGRY